MNKTIVSYSVIPDSGSMQIVTTQNKLVCPYFNVYDNTHKYINTSLDLYECLSSNTITKQMFNLCRHTYYGLFAKENNDIQIDANVVSANHVKAYRIVIHAPVDNTDDQCKNYLKDRIDSNNIRMYRDRNNDLTQFSIEDYYYACAITYGFDLVVASDMLCAKYDRANEAHLPKLVKDCLVKYRRSIGILNRKFDDKKFQFDTMQFLTILLLSSSQIV